MSTTEAVLAQEHAGWRALCDGTAHDFYGGVMTEDAAMILADGTVMNRTQVVDSLQHAPPWDGYSIDDPVVQVLDDAVALLRYTGTGRRNDGDDFTAAMVSVYVRAAGEWRLASYQQTPSDRA